MSEVLINSGQALCSTDSYHDGLSERRLSDLLPTDFLNQIGLDPNYLIYGNNSHPNLRRATCPNLPDVNTFFSPTKRTNSLNSLSQPTLRFFLIDIKGIKAYAFTTLNIDNINNPSECIIQDGFYRRHASIIQGLSQNDIQNEPYEIVSFDVNTQFIDMISSQSQIALELAKSYVKSHEIPTEIISAETVSYNSRSLIRIQVSDQNVKGI